MRIVLLTLVLASSPAPVLADTGEAPDVPQVQLAPVKQKTVAEQIVDLRRHRSDLLSRYTAQHPEVRIVDRQIQNLEAEQARLGAH